MKNIFWIFRN